jgi:phosphoglycerol transferase MdoB-like AlkP superfamily enzyme
MDHKNSLRSDWRFWLSLALALWFVCTAWVWTYLANLVLATPAGLLSFALWRVGKPKADSPKRYRWITRLWLLGTGVSLLVLVGLLLTN